MVNVIIKKEDYQEINLKLQVDKLKDMDFYFELIFSSKSQSNEFKVVMNPSDLIQLRDKINDTIFKLT
ncbi:hypothetical protein CEY02_20585 [Bacillus pumilus]|uniref:Uncharacterized protein n=1 Tax=Bacillus pumilus TaxID=1408 RepID=A0A2A5IEI1_BACPU|nr:hypothetical protein CEY02_20585 [Bacillus pumilus]